MTNSAGARATPAEATPAAPAWRDLLSWARPLVPHPMEARFIVEQVAGVDHLAPVSAEEAPPEAVALVHELVARRAAGEPLQYVLGRWGFRTLDLMVDRRVLIPRPETEQVVEVALAELRHNRSWPSPVVADLGTGSGAIALSVATEAPGADVWASDASPDALAVASANRSSLGLDGRVRLVGGSWYAALPPALEGRLSLVVSNPPYIAASEVPGLPAEVRDWEPTEALVAGPTGLDAITEILRGAPRWLQPGGSVVVELAPHQADAGVALAHSAGLSDVEVGDDLAGRQRVLVARAA